MATVEQEIKLDVVGNKCPKFKAGSELSPTVNALYVDTNEGSQDGSDYEYTVKFSIIDPLRNV